MTNEEIVLELENLNKRITRHEDEVKGPVEAINILKEKVEALQVAVAQIGMDFYKKGER